MKQHVMVDSVYNSWLSIGLHERFYIRRFEPNPQPAAEQRQPNGTITPTTLSPPFWHLLSECSYKSKGFAFQTVHPQLCLGFFHEGGNLKFKARAAYCTTIEMWAKIILRKIMALAVFIDTRNAVNETCFSTLTRSVQYTAC